MSEQEKKLDGPDFARGVSLGDLTEGSMISGQVGGEAVVLARTGGALFAIGAECTITTVRSPRDAGGGYRPLSLAPCLLQPAHWRGIARPGAEPSPVLAGRATRRKIYVREKLEPAERRARTAAGQCQSRSLSSAAVRRETPRPRCFGARAIPARSRC